MCRANVSAPNRACQTRASVSGFRIPFNRFGAANDADGVQLGNPFSFTHNVHGFTEKLWDKLRQNLHECNPERVVFAIETSCNLWQVLSFYLAAEGYEVIFVSPLTTRRSRPFFNHDFSHTDPKDALLIASNARNGYFDFYRTFSTEINAMHQLSLTYCKLVLSKWQSWAP